jgi:hypothetical protein
MTARLPSRSFLDRGQVGISAGAGIQLLHALTLDERAALGRHPARDVLDLTDLPTLPADS